MKTGPEEWSFLYAVTDASTPAGSAPARIVTAAGLRAWGGADPARAGEVCVKLARRGGCLPARAGARVSGGANAVRAWLRRTSEELKARLALIDDRVEFVATLEDRRPPAAADPSRTPRRTSSDAWLRAPGRSPLSAPPRRGSGAGYLRAAAAAAAEKRAAQEALRGWAAEIADALPPALAAAPRRITQVAPGRVDLSILAPPAAKSVFALGLLDCARRLSPDLALSGSGPWAPHSFADIALGELRRASSQEVVAHASRA